MKSSIKRLKESSEQNDKAAQLILDLQNENQRLLALLDARDEEIKKGCPGNYCFLEKHKVLFLFITFWNINLNPKCETVYCTGILFSYFFISVLPYFYRMCA